MPPRYYICTGDILGIFMEFNPDRFFERAVKTAATGSLFVYIPFVLVLDYTKDTEANNLCNMLFDFPIEGVKPPTFLRPIACQINIQKYYRFRNEYLADGFRDNPSRYDVRLKKASDVVGFNTSGVMNFLPISANNYKTMRSSAVLSLKNILKAYN